MFAGLLLTAGVAALVQVSASLLDVRGPQLILIVHRASSRSCS